MRDLLVFDADCGPCSRFRRVIDFIDPDRRLDFMPLVEADARGLLDGVPQGRRHRSFHLISPQGGVTSGASALPVLLALLPAGRLPSKAIQCSNLMFRSVAFVYSVFSRLHDASSCSYGQSHRSLQTASERAELRASYNATLNRV